MRPRLQGSFALALCLMLQACEREHIVQTPTMINVMTQEMSAGKAAASGSGTLTRDRGILGPVVRVASRLIAAARRSDYGARARAVCWVIAVYDDGAMLRSFVQPDGAIVLSTGTFRLAETEAGLAAVLSHELVHALAHEYTPAPPVCVSTAGQFPPLYTTEQELQTDEAGLTLMADAGYDPRELLALWERMKRLHEAEDKVLVHFTYERRMERIAQGLPHALQRYEHANRAPQKMLPRE